MKYYTYTYIQKRMFKICFVNIFIFVIFSNYVNASNLDPEKILDGVDDLYRSNASHGIITLSVTTVNWQRTLTLEQWIGHITR